jgi:aminoglycoside/choline kinase family phosphotransferase
MNASFLKASQKIKDNTPLAGDAGNRAYSRVKFEGSDSNYILCKYPDKDSLQLKNFLDVYHLLTENSVNTPQIIESSNSQMLLEDLGDLSLEDHFKSCGTGYLSALDQLINIQKIPIEGGSKAQSFSFTVEKFVWEMNFTLTHFIKFLGITLSEKDTEALQKDFVNLCTHLCSLEQVITHRDLHSRNIMINQNKAYIIDFQDARIGPKFYDLVSLVEDSYTNLESEFKKELIETYCNKTKVSCDQNFMSDYHLQNLQRAFKACGSFASFKNRTNNERYLQYLTPAFQSLIDSCSEVKGFSELKKFIKLSSDAWKKHA